MDSYDLYRKKYRSFVAAQEEEKAALASQQRQAEKERRAEENKSSSKAPVVNRAQERKEIAKRKERIRYLEKTIAELEEEQKTLEAGFGKDTSAEDYKKYADNAEKLDSMYNEYMELENS